MKFLQKLIDKVKSFFNQFVQKPVEAPRIEAEAKPVPTPQPVVEKPVEDVVVVSKAPESPAPEVVKPQTEFGPLPTGKPDFGPRTTNPLTVRGSLSVGNVDEPMQEWFIGTPITVHFSCTVPKKVVLAPDNTWRAGDGGVVIRYNNQLMLRGVYSNFVVDPGHHTFELQADRKEVGLVLAFKPA